MERGNITVSIIVPVYNMELYLESCLASLVNQKLKNMEIIVVDDGSTDGSGEIIGRFMEQYPSLFQVIHKENGGQGSARNIGISLSQGSYIGFVDADDKVAPEMYERMLQAALESGCDLVECNYHFLQAGEDGDIELPAYGHVRRYSSNKDMFLDPLVSPWNKLYRGDLLRNHGLRFPEGFIYEDTSFYVKAIPYIHKWEYIDEKFVYHYQRANSTMTAVKSARVGNIFPVLDDIWSFYEKEQLLACYRQEVEYFCTKILLCSSLKRIADVQQKDIRRQLQKETITYLRRRMPNYKSNMYVHNNALGLYMKAINRYTIGIICVCLQVLKKIKK